MTKKSKPLSPEQFQQLLIATANLPFIHLERPETDFILHVLETPINLQMRAEVVVKALTTFGRTFKRSMAFTPSTICKPHWPVTPTPKLATKRLPNGCGTTSTGHGWNCSDASWLSSNAMT